MPYFAPDNARKSDDKKRVYAIFEIAYTTVDFCAALAFTVGSVLFFFKATQTEGTWLFLIGSILFAVKPSLRLARETKLAAMGDPDDVAQRLET